MVGDRRGGGSSNPPRAAPPTSRLQSRWHATTERARRSAARQAQCPRSPSSLRSYRWPPSKASSSMGGPCVTTDTAASSPRRCTETMHRTVVALGRCRPRRRGKEPSRSTTKVTQVHPTLLGRGRQTRSQVQGLVELRADDGGLLTHVTKDRALSPRGDQGIGYPIDPDPGAAAIPAVLPGDSLEGKDAIRTRELAEAQSHHPSV